LADRRVVGYFGDRGSLASIVRVSAARDVDVVTVAFDLGGSTSLGGLRDEALAAGAVRCHALDAREEFAREVLFLAVSAGAADPRAAMARLAERFIAGRLQSIAQLEAAIDVESTRFTLPWSTPPARRGAHGAASISLRFAEGVPVDLNGIAMTAAELVESVETITGLPAVDVLHLAYADLSACPDGIVELRAERGRVEVARRLVVS
jgi:argininosuccinate synthase